MKINDILLNSYGFILKEYKTKDGKEILIKRFDDVEKENRGWKVDQIEAYIGGKNVGYIKMAYIPQDYFKKFYPTIYNWLAQIRGYIIFPLDKKHYHYKNLTNDERRKMLNSYSLYKGISGIPWDDRETYIKSMNDEEILKQIKKLEKELNSHIEGKEFREFKNFHKDKPEVAFIHVENEFRRQGIGKYLYLEAAKWMKEKGMRLHSSGLQSDEAKEVWKHLKKNYKVKEIKNNNKKRKYLEV